MKERKKQTKCGGLGRSSPRPGEGGWPRCVFRGRAAGPADKSEAASIKEEKEGKSAARVFKLGNRMVGGDIYQDEEATFGKEKPNVSLFLNSVGIIKCFRITVVFAVCLFPPTQTEYEPQ